MVSSSQYGHENIFNVDERIPKMIGRNKHPSFWMWRFGVRVSICNMYLCENSVVGIVGDTQPLGTLAQATEVFNAILSAVWKCHCLLNLLRRKNMKFNMVMVLAVFPSLWFQEVHHVRGCIVLEVNVPRVTSLNSYFIKKKLKLVEGQIEVLHSTVNSQDLVGPSAKSPSTNLVNRRDNRNSPSSLPSTQHHCRHYHHC